MPDARAYAPELSKLKAGNPTGDAKRWEQACRDADSFMADWGDDALRLGWTGDDLFGFHPLAPLARYDAMGLMWSLQGKDVSELTASFARIGNGRFYRRQP